MPRSSSCSVSTSYSGLPVTSSQHQSCLLQQLEIPLSVYNCISAKQLESLWIIWHHRPWWIISDHIPWKTHILYFSQRLCHMHSGLSMEAAVAKRLGSKWKHGRYQKVSICSCILGAVGSPHQLVTAKGELARGVSALLRMTLHLLTLSLSLAFHSWPLIPLRLKQNEFL